MDEERFPGRVVQGTPFLPLLLPPPPPPPSLPTDLEFVPAPSPSPCPAASGIHSGLAGDQTHSTRPLTRAALGRAPCLPPSTSPEYRGSPLSLHVPVTQACCRSSYHPSLMNNGWPCAGLALLLAQPLPTYGLTALCCPRGLSQLPPLHKTLGC